MACLKTTELIKESNKVMNMWANSKTLKRFNFTDDQGTFKRLFDTVTGKPFLEGMDINATDMKKMQIAIKDLEADLKNPGALSNKLLRHLYVGSAKAMRNPITSTFYNILVNANEYRNRNTQALYGHYKDFASNFKLALIESDGMDTSNMSSGHFKVRDALNLNIAQGVKNITNKNIARRKKHKLMELEKDYIKASKNKENIGTINEWLVLKKFLNGEGQVFQDLIDRIEMGNNKGLNHKYRNSPRQKRVGYVLAIEKAANDWAMIQNQSKQHLVRAIDNLTETVKLKYSDRSKTADFLIKEYKEVAKQLNNQEGGYVPHFVLDLLGQSMEIREKINKSTSDKGMDNILREYAEKTRDINVNLTDRLRKKGKEATEYYSRNPFLYAEKYIQQVTQFNHSTEIDRAYVTGLKELSNVIFKNPNTKEADAAKTYKDILNEFYTLATGKNRVDSAPELDNITRFLTSLQFTSKLGISTRGALRNLSQRTLNWAYFGEQLQYDAFKAYKGNKVLNEAMLDRLNYHGLEFVDISKVTEGALDAADLLADGIDYEKGIFTYKERDTILKKMTKAGVKIADASSFLTKMVETGNRKSTFKNAFYRRVEQLKRTKDFANWGEDSKVADEMYRQAGYQAAKMTSMLHFEYSPFGKASGITGRKGSLLFQFQHYRMSMFNLQTQLYKDFKRAAKAGDYTGEEFKRMIRLYGIHAMSEALSVAGKVNFTTYIANESLQWLMGWKDLILGTEEEQKDAFYGKGLVGALGMVPVSDAVELVNLGAAAGYWNLLADEDSYAGWLSGMRKYKSIDDDEFKTEALGMLNIELDRLWNRTIPALRSSDIIGAARVELGLYPGQTTLGLKTRELHQRVMGTEKDKSSAMRFGVKRYEKLTKKSRDEAIRSLDFLRKN